MTPQAYKDKRIVTLKISTDPNTIQSIDSKSALRCFREWGKKKAVFSLADSQDFKDSQPMRNQDSNLEKQIVLLNFYEQY